MAKYRPNGFSRQDGWLGKTYLDAYDFCGQQEGGRICPYDAVCPMGPNTQALGVFGVATEVSWMPISENVNDWVQLGGNKS